MKKELETPLNEAIDSCNIQRKQYQHTETAYFKHVDVFHASRHSEKKTKLGEDGGQLRNIEVFYCCKNSLKIF